MWWHREPLRLILAVRTRDNKEINVQIAGLTSLGRVGLPDDTGGVVAFLCSDEAKWINGQRIEVAGGIYL
jgi:NAD(P)-dependent dehydrogenase (short-subunit alcohol dehydrogenase family)